MRLDLYLTEQKLAASRQKAQLLIEQGRVCVNGTVRYKSSFAVLPTDQVCVSKAAEDRYVSRGALKLEGAFQAFDLSVSGMRCADFGASTGGFTQVLLEHGASLVYSLDVGHGQLHPTLLDDERVVNLEGCNLRYAKPEQIGGPVAFLCGDLSFISLTLILPTAAAFLQPGGQAVFLVKPQFEAGRRFLDAHGIVKDQHAHLAAIVQVAQAAVVNHLKPVQVAVSPIVGGDGNREFLLYLKKAEGCFLSEDFLVKAKQLAINDASKNKQKSRGHALQIQTAQIDCRKGER